MDVPVFATGFYEKFGYDRPVYTLSHDIIFTGPTGDFFRKTGFIGANHENADEALRSGGVVIVFPGGDYDVYRPTLTENKIDFDGRTGYVRAAINAGVPIVPSVSIGGQQAQLFLSRGEWMAKTLRLDKLLRAKILPISFGFPFGLSAPCCRSTCRCRRRSSRRCCPPSTSSRSSARIPTSTRSTPMSATSCSGLSTNWPRNAACRCWADFVALTDRLGGAFGLVTTMARAGIIAPLRPDKYLRIAAAMARENMGITSGFAAAAQRCPDRAGLVDEIGTLTWREIDQRADAFASALQAFVVRPTAPPPRRTSSRRTSARTWRTTRFRGTSQCSKVCRGAVPARSFVVSFKNFKRMTAMGRRERKRYPLLRAAAELANAANAVQPLGRDGYITIPVFFLGWPTGEAAPVVAGASMLDALRRGLRGDFKTGRGRVALALTVLSWGVLGFVYRRNAKSQHNFEDPLKAALGENYGAVAERRAAQTPGRRAAHVDGAAAVRQEGRHRPIRPAPRQRRRHLAPRRPAPRRYAHRCYSRCLAARGPSGCAVRRRTH